MASVLLSVLFLLSLLPLLHTAEEEMRNTQKCPRFPCGNVKMIGFPFANTSYPECGVFTVECHDFGSRIQLGDGGRSYPLLNISQDNTLRIFDEELSEGLKSASCESLTNLTFPSSSFFSFELAPYPIQTFFRCNRTLNISSPPHLKIMPCGHSDIYYNTANESFPGAFSGCSIIQLPKNLGENSTWLPNGDDPFSLVTPEIKLEVHVLRECYGCYYYGGQCKGHAYGNFYCDGAEKGIKAMRRALGSAIFPEGDVSDECSICKNEGGQCKKESQGIFYCDREKKAKPGMEVNESLRFVMLITSWLRMIYFRKKECLAHQTVQSFLRNHLPLAIGQYTYSDIKKMTNFFKNKLGEGGYGGVYKGKLKDGHLVAVKVLKQSKGNGEEFINEVASISRTSHVNIVSLVGFCFEDSKRALIYEFMLNGSLDKFIYKANLSRDDHHLSWETLYKIALGIARGLEYLHKGCNTRILHFDIKPHNILLDENLCPKISDFGLAKICPREQSIVSMLGTRGTIGYIAPEVFCRSFGGVSHKSDVYSYGMLVFEMIGGRRNIEVDVDHTSEIYFPHWIYNRLEQDENFGLQSLLNEKDHEHVRNMIIVSLWCVQTDPLSRPSMSRVVNMLEGLEQLEIPPKPFMSSPSRSQESSSARMESMQYNFVIT